MPVTIESPFPAMEAAQIGVAEAPAVAGEADSPFLTEYGSDTELRERQAESFRELLNELYDAEFDEALLELVSEADAHVDRLGLAESSDNGRTERVLETWLEPLRREAEAMIDQMAEALEGQTPESLDEARIDELLRVSEPAETGLEPQFEDFLGKLWKKASGAIKGAVKLAKRGVSAALKALPIPNLLAKLKGLVRPLLRQVLKLALNRLPPALRPAAAQLAKRFLGEDESIEETDEASPEVPASTPVAALQESLDVGIAGLLLTSDEPRQELFLADVAAMTEADGGSVAELDEARERFERGLEGLAEGEDPTPLVEQFIPAILPALRLGISVVGRRKVVGFLAGYLGRLISPYVGPQMTPALSRAIVDAGLRLMTLEAESEETDGRLASEAVSGLVEDTVARLAELSEEELSDDRLLEATTYEAVQEAVAANFPPAALASDSEFLETNGEGGAWVAMPRRRRPRYRKFSHTYPISISPQIARTIRTWGGAPLSTFLSDRYGVSGPVRARVHLYRAIPGTTVARIARAERGVSGLGPDFDHGHRGGQPSPFDA